ncbi:hypothetical protein DFH06DRAFT_1270583 [Mycena polygramma]|nr:hypothetical protein DFH06DRAFT_1270583 [Mycena polygramma]
MASKYPDYLSPNVTPSKLLSKAQKSRARREPSGVFSLFQAPQIQQFKEAFQLIDHDKDGWVGEKDLREIFASLGISPSDATLDELLRARPGDAPTPKPGDASERGAELLEAFESFDEADEGVVRVEEMRKALGEVGERMGEREIDKLLKGPFTDRQGNFNYREWVKVLRVNEEEEQPVQ